ncbi:MAG TPA: hypothetical protein VEO54_31710 [Thermoanaerobaculia bacterium]|nr:hypothetical protein [Thermoanaerobaculia bacterium]
MFFRGSRYAKVEEARLTTSDGREVAYKKTRFIPVTTGRFGHMVDEGERLDHIAWRYYRDPERFWRLCDANAALWPDDLVAEPGRTIVVPPSEG